MTSFSPEIQRLLGILWTPPWLSDRIRGTDERRGALELIGASGEYRVVPTLIAMLLVDKTLTPDVARAISRIVERLNPAELAWLDEEGRREIRSYSWAGQSRQILPEDVPAIASLAGWDPAAIGVLAFYPDGFVRAAALEELARITGGREIPHLALRVNDWVAPVAARARALLLDRLRPDNHRAVLDALPFLVRTLRQSRRDHADIGAVLTKVLTSDGGESALTRAGQFDTGVRRFLFERLLVGADHYSSPVIQRALADPDSVIRVRAIVRLATAAKSTDAAALFERLLRDDPLPAVRRAALTALSEHLPERVAGLFPSALFDRTASVRARAQFVARAHRLPLVPRDLYVERLTSARLNELAATIEGVGEAGTRADAALVLPFLESSMPNVRRATLRACARLDPDRAIPAAIAALHDASRSVRTAAMGVLVRHPRLIDFHLVNRQLRTLGPHPRLRQSLLRLLARAPKWDALAFLLEALKDPDEDVRAIASGLVDLWVSGFNRTQTQPSPEQRQRIEHLLELATMHLSPRTAELLRFSIKSL